MKVTILKLAENRFRLRVETKDEFGKRKFTYETIRGSQAEAEARKTQLAKGAVVATGRSYIFNEYFQQWLTDRAAFGEIEDSTEAAYESNVKPFSRLLGHKRITEITRDDIENAWRFMLKNCTPAQVQNAVKVVRAMFNSALQNRDIEINPVSGCRTPILASAPKESTLTKEQMQMVAERAKEWGQIGVLVRLAMATGLRRGELCGLQWQDINFEARTIVIRRAIRRVRRTTRVAVAKSKTSFRTVSVPENMVSELRELRAQRQETFGRTVELTDFVFAEPDQSYMHPNRVTDRVSYQFEKLALKDFSLHDLRHAHATYLLQQKMPLKSVSQRLGHSDVSITLKIYNHVMPGDDEQLAHKIADVF